MADGVRSLSLRLRSGAIICVPPRLQVITTYVLLEQEAWFEPEVEFVRRALQPGECACDVGANFGVYSTAMGGGVGSTGTVVAFEPAAETCAYLRATLAGQSTSHVRVVQAAVSDRAGRARLKIHGAPELNALAAADDHPPGEDVAVVALDEFDLPRPLALIKIDAEGHELAVARGAAAVLQEDEPLLLFEIAQGTTVDFALPDYLAELGWSLYRLAPAMNLLVPFERSAVLDHRQLNLFACSPRRAEWLRARGLLARRAGEVADKSSTSEDRFATLVASERPPRTQAYRETIERYLAAGMLALGPEQRLAQMTTALRLAQAAVEESASLARQITLGRILADFLPSAAVASWRRIIQSFARLESAALDEMCLAPSARHTPDAMLRTALFETMERQHEFSSRFAAAGHLKTLEHICSLPDSAPEMHRRLQLARILHGVQAGIQPSSILQQESPDNLNAWFWRR